MPEINLPTKRELAKWGILASALAGSVVASRYFGTRKISGAERLAEALLDTESLREAGRDLSEASEKALAACAAYLVHMAFRSAEGLGAASGAEDPIGYSRTHTHPYTHAAATVLTEAGGADARLTYAVNVPDVGEVRGTRHIGPVHISGLCPARRTPDIAQITLADGYTAQLESEFEVGDYLVTGRTRLFGAATLRDNRGNVGRLNIGYDGTISGTITREARVIGRFEGRVAHGLNFKRYQLESGE
ncbi:MAG TPA: hypothetical protein VFB21_01570 [Chthonomonadaceae bacterium]|nr:hypothetical protein [Chthonomonadaceae bacterium]